MVNFAYLQSLIEGCNYTLFYDIAIHYLVGMGYRQPVIVDGKNDRGTDVTIEGSPDKIQLSVRKDWKAKVNEEANRYSQGDFFIYITSRRVPRGDLEDFLAGSEYKKKGIVAFEIVDSQKLASMLVRTNRGKLVCELLGAPWSSGNFTIKESAVASLLIFSPESKNIRQEYIKWLVCCTLHARPASKQDVITQILLEQGLQDAAHAQIGGAIDSLRQAGIVSGNDSNLVLSKSKQTEIDSARSNFNGILSSLPGYIQSLVTNITVEDSERVADVAVQRASLLDDADSHKTSEIDGVLQKYGVIDIVEREHFYEKLSQHRAFQLYGMSGVVGQLLTLDKSDLFASLTAKGQINFYFDSSVAIPMLLSLLFQKGSGRYAFVGAAIYGELERLHLPLFIPDVYVEEMAAHAHLALEEFEIEAASGTSALKKSRNAFVSHFARLSTDLSQSAFYEFLADFDIRPNIEKKRNISNGTNMMRDMLSSYGINSFKTTLMGNRDIYDFLRSIRPMADHIILEHDTRVIRTIRELPPEQRNIVCSWDTGMTQYSKQNSGIFECFRPTVMMDILNYLYEDYSDERPNFNVLDAFLLDIEPDVQRISSVALGIQNGTDINALRSKKKSIEGGMEPQAEMGSDVFRSPTS